MNTNKTRSKSKTFIKKFIRGTEITLCIYVGFTGLANYKSNDATQYKLMRDIDDNPKYILAQVKDHTGIETNDNPNLVLIHAIMNNNKLDDEEKEYFYKLLDLISENPYIDKKATYNHLHDLDIVYTKRPAEYDETVLAIYSESENVVKVFESKDSFNEEIFFHELVHSIFTNEVTINLPKFILEGQTELLTNEYISEKPFIERTTYPFEVAMVKILCEMVGEDEVLKTYTTGDMNSLYDKLNYTNNRKEAVDFVSNIDNIFRAFQDGKTIPIEKYNNMISYMDNFFNSNYQNDIEKLEIYNYYRGIIYLLNEEKPYEAYNKYIEENGVIVKAYYSDKLKETYPITKRAYIEKKQQKTLKK